MFYSLVSLKVNTLPNPAPDDRIRKKSVLQKGTTVEVNNTELLKVEDALSLVEAIKGYEDFIIISRDEAEDPEGGITTHLIYESISSGGMFLLPYKVKKVGASSISVEFPNGTVYMPASDDDFTPVSRINSVPDTVESLL